MSMKSFHDTRDANPYPLYEELLAAGPVHWDEGMNAWLVVGYDESRYVQLHEEIFVHPYNDLRGAAEVYGGRRGVLLLKGEEHTVVHKFLLSHFSPAVVRKYRESFIAALVARRLDTLVGKPEFDLAAEFASLVPSDVIAALIGLDWEDHDLLSQCRTWNTTMFRWTETFGEDDEALEAALAAARNLNNALLPVIRARKEEPRDDLISLLWEKGPQLLTPWTENEVLAQCRVLFFAGTDTTAHSLRNALYVLVGNPQYQAELRGDVQKIEDFSEEVLRFYAPVHFRVRVAKQDVELGGHLIKAGDRVHPINAANNRDPAHYDRPGEVRLDRGNAKDHLAFNVGPRYCVGAALARGEAVEVIKQVLDRYDSLSWAESAEPATLRGYMPRSFSPLHANVVPRNALVGTRQ